MAGFRLTFGVELEFICAHPRCAFTDPRYPDLVPAECEGRFVSARHAIMYHLLRSNVPATGCEEPGTEVEETSYRRWMVDSDDLFLSDEEQREVPLGYVCEPIEVSSRIFYLTDPAWGDELERVLAVLHLMRHDYGCVFLTNRSTGFHVHVGNDAGSPMPLRTVQKVSQLMTAHERAFDALHAANRITAPANTWLEPDHDSELPDFAPLSFFHHCHSRGRVTNPFHWMRTIETASSFESLGRICSVHRCDTELNGHNAVVNVDNNFPDPEACRYDADLTNTVEFRQHAGTLDVVEIRAYVSLLCSIVQYCHRSSDAEFIHLLVQAAHPLFTAAQLLRRVRAHPDVIAHYTREEDESAAMIGILPDRRVQGIFVNATDRDVLARLSARNDLEEHENADVRGVMEKIEAKYAGLYYGWDPAAGPLHLAQEEIAWMLQRALERTGNAGRARALVWMKLGDIYDDPDGALPDRVVIGKHLCGGRGKVSGDFCSR